MRDWRVRSLIRIARCIVYNDYRFLLSDDLADYVCSRFNVNRNFILGIIEAYRDVREIFQGKSNSWFIRALVRLMYGVHRIGAYSWVLRGIPEFGDYYKIYQVWYSTRDKRYYCSCFTRRFGQIRRKHICTHIAAVMLSRRSRKIGEYL